MTTTNFQEQVLRAQSLARHNTWRVGGLAQFLYRPDNSHSLAQYLAQLASDVPITWLGLGSNVLIRDGGIDGVVIISTPGLSRLQKISPSTVYVESGVSCAKVARFCAHNNLGGAEFFAGIPGTMGGALAMNAGAFGGQTWPLVTSVDTIDRHGCIRQRSAKEFTYGYRSVLGLAGNEWFLGAKLQLHPGQTIISMQAIKTLLANRKAQQPIGLPSCGSVFKNPEHGFAAQLIEACGLKGYRIGQAQVSHKHANFIVHDGKASAADIEHLIMHIKQAVKAKHGVDLDTEVRILGDSLGSKS